MALITWSEQLSVQIDNIDRQHRRWVELVNALDTAVREGREDEQLKKTLADLVDYTHYHFKTEETLMQQADYDAEEFELHRREHRVFADQIKIYKDRQSAGFQKLTPQVMQYLRDWLVTHITASDRGYIAPIKEAGLG